MIFILQKVIYDWTNPSPWSIKYTFSCLFLFPNLTKNTYHHLLMICIIVARSEDADRSFLQIILAAIALQYTSLHGSQFVCILSLSFNVFLAILYSANYCNSLLWRVVSVSIGPHVHACVKRLEMLPKNVTWWHQSIRCKLHCTFYMCNANNTLCDC